MNSDTRCMYWDWEWAVIVLRSILQQKIIIIIIIIQFSERKKAPTPSKEIEKQRDEESWALKNVIFVEDIKTVPVGKVLKVCLLTELYHSILITY